MIEYLSNSNVRISLSGNMPIPVWSITHYLNKTYQRYFKILLVKKICLLASSGISDEKFSVSTKSIQWNDLEGHGPDYGEPIQLAYKSDHNFLFWETIQSHIRPSVFYIDKNGHYQNILNIKTDDLYVSNLSVSSPPEIQFTGLGESLVDVYYGSSREARRIMAEQNQQIGQSAKNINDLINAHNAIANAPFRSPIINYLETMVNDLTNKQMELNEALGIGPKKVNTRP